MTETELVQDILQHYGVKGMHWGVRKEQVRTAVGNAKTAVKKEIADRTGEQVVVRTKPGAGVRTVGGNKQMAHPDAVRVRTYEQIAKKSTIDALSTEDLQKLVTRMNLESQYNTLASKEDRRSKGEKYAKDFLDKNGDAVAGKYKLLNPVVKGVIHVLGKRAPVVNNKGKKK